MTTIEKGLIDYSYFFKDEYSVKKLSYTFDENLIQEIQKGWEYLANTKSQILHIYIDFEEGIEISDDDEFNNEVYYIKIIVMKNEIVAISCSDKYNNECVSEYITKKELLDL